MTQALIRAALEHASCGRAFAHLHPDGSITASAVRHGFTWVVHITCKH